MNNLLNVNNGNNLTFLHRTFAEINLDALDNNIAEIRKVAKNKTIMAVVKANAYGHDSNIICTELWKLHVTHFSVSNIWEAEELRQVLKTAEILIFGYTEIDFLQNVINGNFIHTVGNVTYAKQLSDFAVAANTKIRVHVKINTGMARVGIDTVQELDEILMLEGLHVEGAYTHFAVADSMDENDISYTAAQQSKLLAVAKGKGLLIHSQNSGGILYHNDFEADMVRAGIIMYGAAPNTSLPVPLHLKQVLTLKSTICQIKTVSKDTEISYGRTYKTQCESVIAVIPVGYADGYPRSLSNIGKVAICGVLAPILGRICMDQIIVDITNIPNASIGTVVEIYSDNIPEISIDSIADSVGTIGYELLCNVSHRVPRVAIKGGKIVDVQRYGIVGC